MRSHRCFRLSLATCAFVVSVVGVEQTSAAPSIWSGLTYTFTRPADVDVTHPQYQDAITPNVSLARQSTSGIFNAAAEPSYLNDFSPEYTLWATQFNNPGAPLIAATEWDNLNFTDWRTAYGGAGSLASNIVGANAVVYLTVDDVYLDLRFTQWGSGFSGGGQFTYQRARSAIVPEPATWLLLAAGGLLSIARRPRSCRLVRNPAY